MKNLILAATCFFVVSFCFATTSNLSCLAPENVKKVAESSNSISFDWDDLADPTNQSFQVYYVKDGNASGVYQASSSEITFTNLEEGVYSFHFATVCGVLVSAEIIIVEDVIDI